MPSYQLPIWVWPVALTVVCIIAVRRGGSEERLAAGAVLLGWAISRLVFVDLSEETQWQVLVVDAGVFGVYVYLVLRSARYWPIFAAGFKLLGIITHVAHSLDAGVSGWAYWTAARIFSYLALFTIGYAAWTAPRYAESAGEVTEPGATRR